MKKRNMLFITLLVSILFLGGKVKATTTFEEINDISTTYTDFKEVKLSQVLEVDEGYIIYDNVASSENYVIKLIDFDGNEIWSQTYSGKVKRDTKVTMALIDDDYFIVASSEIGVLKVSVEDGSTVATLNISYSASYGNIQIVSYQDYFAILYSNSTANYVAIVDDEFNILSTTEITDDTLAIGSDDDYVYVLAYSSSYEVITIDSSYATTTLEISDFSSSLYSDGILVYFEGSLYYANEDLLEITCSSSCTASYVSLLSETDYDYNSLAVFGDYLIAGGVYQDDYGFVQVYDSSMNLIQTIEIDDGSEGSAVKSVTATESGFIVKGVYFESSEGYKFIREYVPVYEITTITDGNGSITVSSTSAYYSDLITFTITANSGYTLSTLTLTDASGASVTYELTDESYTFTVSQDTTIEATFSEIVEDVTTTETTTTETTEEVVENPSTGSFIPVVALLGFLVVGVKFIKQKNVISRI